MLESANQKYPLLKGTEVFRNGELIYINKSDDLPEYNAKIHRHHFIEIAYVYSGTGLHIVQDKKYTVNKGDLFILNFDVCHGFFSSTESITPLKVYNCVFMPEFLDSTLVDVQLFQNITTSFLFKSLFPEDYSMDADLKLTGRYVNEFESIFAKMYFEYTNKPNGYTAVLRAYLIELIVKIFRLYDTKTPNPNMHDKNYQMIEQAISYLKHHFHTEIHLEDIASQAFISKNYFSRLFKKTTGKSFSEYIQELRIQKACHLLKNTDKKVIDIAGEIGYNDLKFFYASFKKYVGMTPKEYKIK